jgi:uncharacterized protein
MSEQGTVLSVRGEARLTVAPDFAVFTISIDQVRRSAAEAASAAAATLEQLTKGLESLGGVALTPETERGPLTWSAQSAASQPEYGDHGERTGRVSAAVAIEIDLRDFTLVDQLSELLASQEALSLDYVSWHADWDNPAWPQVRADAIRAAVRKGRDYAAALGGTLTSIQHLADLGLLSGGGDDRRRLGGHEALVYASSNRGPDAPSLNPVPQELAAAVEARFVADGLALSGDL